MPREIAVRIVTGVFLTLAGLVFAFGGSTLVGMVLITKSTASLQPNDVDATMPGAIAALDFAFHATAIIFLVGLGVAAIAFLSTVITCVRWLVSRAKGGLPENRHA